MSSGFFNRKVEWLPEKVWKRHEGRVRLKEVEGDRVLKVVSKNKKPFEEFVDTGRNPDAERGGHAMPAMNS